MGRPKKLKENKKAFYRQCLKAMGMWEHFQDARTAAMRRGLKGVKAWRQALKEVPIPPDVKQEVIQARLAGEPAQKLPPMLRPEECSQEPIGRFTGSPILDWVFANMGRRVPWPPPGPGYLEMLRYYQARPELFYPKIWIPACMRRSGY